jgi:uncharacterized protein
MHSIPSFPERTPLVLAHASVIQPYLIQHRQGISEYSMASLYPFTKKRHYTVSSFVDEDGKLQYVFYGQKSNDIDSGLYAFLPGGYPGKVLLDQIFETVDEINTIGEHQLHSWQENLEKSHHAKEIIEDRDNADYLYERKDLIELVGQSLHKKLVHAHRFAEDHPDRVLIPAHLVQQSDMVAVLDAWAAGRDVVEDYNSTLTAINHQEELNLRGAVLYAKDRPVAFTLGEYDGPSRFIIHIEKAITELKGVYQYINRAFAASLPDSVLEINREQDLGIPGLRQAKLTYKPSGFVIKYKIKKNSLN